MNAVIVFLYLISLAHSWQVSFPGGVSGSALSPSAWFSIQSTDTIVAVNIENGQLLWSYNITEENGCLPVSPFATETGCHFQTNIKYDLQSGNLFVAAVANENTVTPRPAGIFAIDQTGKVVWNASIPIESNVGGITTTITPGIVYALASGYNMIVTAFDAKTGHQLWQSVDNSNLDTRCMVGYLSWGLNSDGQSTVIYHCGPNVIAWDTKGNELWNYFGYTPNFAGLIIDSDTVVYNAAPTTCKYSLSNFKEIWCIKPMGDSINAVSPDGPMLSFVLEYFDVVIGYTIASYDNNGNYMWTAPVTANYTGIVVQLSNPVYGDNVLWYWMTGQSGIMYVLEPETGKVVQTVKNLDPQMKVIYVDKSGNVYAQGSDYLMVNKFN